MVDDDAARSPGGNGAAGCSRGSVSVARGDTRGSTPGHPVVVAACAGRPGGASIDASRLKNAIVRASTHPESRPALDSACPQRETPQVRGAQKFSSLPGALHGCPALPSTRGFKRNPHSIPSWGDSWVPRCRTCMDFTGNGGLPVSRSCRWRHRLGEGCIRVSGFGRSRRLNDGTTTQQ